MAVQLSSLTPDLANRRYPDIDIHVTLDWAKNIFECMGYSQKAALDLKEGSELPFSFFACPREGEFKVFRDLGIDLKQLLHVSQTYSYYQKACVGDWIQSRVSINKLINRKLGGQEVVFIELKNRYFLKETLIAEAEGTVIVRSVGEGA